MGSTYAGDVILRITFILVFNVKRKEMVIDTEMEIFVNVVIPRTANLLHALNVKRKRVAKDMVITRVLSAIVRTEVPLRND